MLFVFHLIDRLDAGNLRQEVRPRHKDYLAQAADRIAFAGPLLADDGVTMRGSLLVMEFDDREAAQRWLSEEPFTRAGLYQRSEISRFTNLWPQKTGFAPASS